MKQRILWKTTQEPVKIGQLFAHAEGPTTVLEITQDWRILVQFQDAKIRPNYRLLELEEAGAQMENQVSVKPPQGLRPRFIWVALRIDEIRDAIERHEAAGIPIPRAWAVELAALQGTTFASEPMPDMTCIENVPFETAYSVERLNLLKLALRPFAYEIEPIEIDIIETGLYDRSTNSLVAEAHDPVVRKLLAFFLNNASNLLKRN